MKLSEAIEILRNNTMGCWWPDPALGTTKTDWDGIFSEVDTILENIKLKQGIPLNAKFFVLSDSDGGSKLYDQLSTAMTIVVAQGYQSPTASNGMIGDYLIL